MDSLTPSFDLSDRVIYFPVRHHSPACAWHIAKLIRDVRPDHVLIEGPRDANHILPLLDHEQTRQPVAIYATFVDHASKQNSSVARYAAYYPLCDFSPELNAIRRGREVGADVQFIDLSFAEKVKLQEPTANTDSDSSVLQQPQSLARATNLQGEPWYSHSGLLNAACKRTGARDSDDLWDHLFEVRFRETSTQEFMRGVWAYCSLARRDHHDSQLVQDGCIAREQAMAFAVSQCRGKTIVVTGGFHAVVLAQTSPALSLPTLTSKDDAQVVLMRYSFDQLDRLNGYASGMPSPGFYQSMWEGETAASLLVRIARECRQLNLPASTADVEAAVHQVHLLAKMRGHVQASREDLLDAVRSLFVKGEMDREGVAVLAIARKLLAGDTVGEVPEEAGQPPIVNDFRSRAAWLKLKLEKIDTTRTSLDLYRNARHRQTSRLFHQLAFLQIPFATFVQGPDFVTGTELHRVREVWSYHWSPQTESSLIVTSVYGATLEEAASARLLEQFAAAESEGYGGSASVATQLVVLACRMGLHRQSKSLFLRLETLLGRDGKFYSVVQALENLLLLNTSKEPLEARNLPEVMPLARNAFHRACYLMHRLPATPEMEEAEALDALNTLALQCSSMPDPESLRPTLHTALQQLLSAQNSLISSWTAYETSRMNLYRDLGFMQVNGEGIWINEHDTSFQTGDAASQIADGDGRERAGDAPKDRPEVVFAQPDDAGEAEPLPPP